ncbi:MAG TPA: NAD-dependent epimerase/dehydratase family protein, partial [Anaerolineales bacterium]|nr:NAD-dependent epimerase/dehydratase family protein [Anaerolineales bacterium]
MNILVTGGAGYIGSATAEALVKAGHAVTVYDSLVTGHREAVPEGTRFVEADLSDSHALAKTLTDQKFEAIIHFAAATEAGESMKDPGRFYHNNVTNSLASMETAIRAGVKRFVLSSTAAVFQSSDEPLTEASPLGPTNVYGHTKLMIEQAL